MRSSNSASLKIAAPAFPNKTALRPIYIDAPAVAVQLRLVHFDGIFPAGSPTRSTAMLIAMSTLVAKVAVLNRRGSCLSDNRGHCEHHLCSIAARHRPSAAAVF